MFHFITYLAVLSLLTGPAATLQSFYSSGEMSITSCPITYFGKTYEKLYVAFNESRFALCFNGVYRPGIKNDCILMSGGTADRGNLTVLSKEIPTGSGVHKLLPNIRHTGRCVNVIPLRDSQYSEIEQVELGNFGSQAILGIKTLSGYTHVDVVADAQVDGLSVSRQTFQKNETNTGVITDVSGCRLAGGVYPTNTTVKDPKTCSTITCDVNGIATAVRDCGPMEHCRGDGRCVSNTICTVTGSTVVTFGGKVRSVLDRCGYTLMRSSSIPGLQVLGVFKERRRKDVSFLDRVLLKLDQPSAQISLEQGGRVRLNDQDLMLSARAQVVHGVTLSKDHAGLMAKTSLSNHTVSVVFDGSTALIRVTGPSIPMHGVCGNSSSVTVGGEKVIQHSEPGCEIQHFEPADNMTNCNAMTIWCNMLNHAPFTDCHIDPQPFITACTQTLCQYPAVDGLKCQFLEAYVKTCKHHSNVTVDGWKSQTNCYPSPQKHCQDMFCSSHEFCGLKHNGAETRCLCRALFASMYRPEGAFGEPTLCKGKSASLTMANCLLEDEGIDYSVLHLNDQDCKGEMDNETHMVTFGFGSGDTCGTVIMANDSHIIYKNTIMTRNSSADIINRHDSVQIDFSCFYNQPDIKSLGIKIKHSPMVHEITSGTWNYNLTMKAYTRPDFTHPLEMNSELGLNEKIWVELKTEGLDGEMVVVVTDSCWATDQPSPSGSLKYDLITHGCPNPVDETVQMMRNGLGTSNYFSFNTFQFSGKNSDVYLHCQLHLCIKQSNTCVPNCSRAVRRRRSAVPQYEDANPALISMAWSY